MNYLILQHPGHNRVYYNTAAPIALAELTIAVKKLSVVCQEPDIILLENIRYLSFETDRELTEDDLLLLSRLSFVFAMYILEKQPDKKVLIPIKKVDYEYVDSKISSLLKYKGKTNELFTKTMINVAVLSSTFDPREKIQMLDPVAGKGTTLFEGTVYGYDAFGIEIESKSVSEAVLFFKKYLEAERLKHNSNKRQLYGATKAVAITIQEFTYARNKEEFKSEETIKKWGIVSGNAQDAFNYFKKERFHIIVGDLPYGISHGNAADKKYISKTRNPAVFLSECLPEWNKALKTGGCIVVAWNVFVVSREKLTILFNANGFKVLSHSPYDSFEHRVDQSIKRDLIVAIKEGL